MPTFQKILVPVDGSPPSDEAVRLAIDIARDQGAAVTFIHVTEPARLAAMTSVPAMGVDPSFAISAEREVGERAMSRALAAAKVAGVSAASVLVEGRAIDSIVGAADERGVDLIVVGSHGRTGIARALLGSVAEGVVRRACMPVLVAHSRKPV